MAILQLLRLPGVFTAFADVLAGYLILTFATSCRGNPDILLRFLLPASACLYTSAMAWNDIFDVERDRKLRPERPLPSGRISMTTAFFLAAILSLAGLLCAMAAGMLSFLVAAAIFLLALFYNAGAKNLPGWGGLAIGGCRGLNLFLGMTAYPYLLFLPERRPLLLAPLFLGLYATALTIVSELESSSEDEELPPSEEEEVMAMSEKNLEHHPQGTPKLRRGEWLILFLGIGTLFLTPIAGLLLLGGDWLGGGLFGIVFLLLANATLSIRRDDVRTSIRTLIGSAILAIPFLDGALVAGLSSQSLEGDVLLGVLLVVGMALPALVLQRRIAVT